MTRFVIAAMALLVSVGLAAAQRGAPLTDPTGTPLNVRESPNGKITDTLANGKPWVKIEDSKTKSPSAGCSASSSPASNTGESTQIPLASRPIIPIVQRLRGRRSTARTRI